MFDPDWTAFNADALNMIDRWLAQQAGGWCCCRSGLSPPMDTDADGSSDESDQRFLSRSLFRPRSVLGGGRQGGDNAWPIEFTAESRRAEFFGLPISPKRVLTFGRRLVGCMTMWVSRKRSRVRKSMVIILIRRRKLGTVCRSIWLRSFMGRDACSFKAVEKFGGSGGRATSTLTATTPSSFAGSARDVCCATAIVAFVLVDPSRAMVGDTISVRAILYDEQFEPLEFARSPRQIVGPRRTHRRHSLATTERRTPRGNLWRSLHCSRSRQLRIACHAGGCIGRTGIAAERASRDCHWSSWSGRDEMMPSLSNSPTMTGGAYLPVEEDTTTAERQSRT